MTTLRLLPCVLMTVAIGCGNSAPQSRILALANSASISGEAWVDAGSVSTPTTVKIEVTVDTVPPTMDTRLFTIGQDSEWSGGIPVGDSYTISVLDAVGELVEDARVTGGTVINGTLNLIFPESVDDDADNTFTLVESDGDMLITGDIHPEPGSQPLYEIEFSLVWRSFVMHSETVLLSPNASGVATVQHTLPNFSEGGYCVVGLAKDSNGDPVEMHFAGSGTVGLTTIPANDAPGGFVMFNCGVATNFGKKEVAVPGKKKKAVMAYLLKLGKFDKPPQQNPNCFLCEWSSRGHDPGTDGFAPSRKPGSRPNSNRPNQKTTAPTLLLCNGTNNTGFAGGGQTVAIVCWEHQNFEMMPDGGNKPLPFTGVDYSLFAHEPWVNGDGSTGQHVDDWQGDAAPGATPPSYGGATATGTNGSGSVNMMHDGPGARVPRNQNEDNELFLNETYGPNADYTKLTYKYEFRTYLVCCATDTVIASYKWDFTVCIKPKTIGGKKRWTSKVTEHNSPTEQATAQDSVFNALIPEDETFPC